MGDFYEEGKYGNTLAKPVLHSAGDAAWFWFYVWV